MQTTPALLGRTRDFDANIRKLVYTKLTENLESPKLLTVGQREMLVRNGLEDRETAVQEAAAKLVGGWVEISDDILKFLELFDLMSDVVGEKALLSAFETKPSLLDMLDFGGELLSICGVQYSVIEYLRAILA